MTDDRIVASGTRLQRASARCVVGGRGALCVTGDRGRRRVAPELLAGPVQLWDALGDVLREGYGGTTLAHNLTATVGRCLAGFAAAAILGVPLGLLMGL